MGFFSPHISLFLGYDLFIFIFILWNHTVALCSIVEIKSHMKACLHLGILNERKHHLSYNYIISCVYHVTFRSINVIFSLLFY